MTTGEEQQFHSNWYQSYSHSFSYLFWHPEQPVHYLTWLLCTTGHQFPPIYYCPKPSRDKMCCGKATCFILPTQRAAQCTDSSDFLFHQLIVGFVKYLFKLLYQFWDQQQTSTVSLYSSSSGCDLKVRYLFLFILSVIWKALIPLCLQIL